VLLLTHIAEAFEASGATQLSTATLLSALVGRDDGPWAGWWEKDLNDGRVKGPSSRLAHLLKRFSITPDQLWVAGAKTRGYKLESFREAFGSYLSEDLPPPPPAPTDHENGRTVGAGQGMFPENDDNPPQPSDLRTTVLPFENPSEMVGADDDEMEWSSADTDGS
jgi:hypothetical protein